MKFRNAAHLKKCISYYSITKGFPIKLERNAKRRITDMCTEGCPWRLHASYMQLENTF